MVESRRLASSFQWIMSRGIVWVSLWAIAVRGYSFRDHPGVSTAVPSSMLLSSKTAESLTIVWLFLIMMTQGFLSQTMNANSKGNKAVMSPDRDSLVALDALLRIRESGALDSASNQNALQARTEGSSTPRLPSIAVAPAPLQPLPEWAARLGSLLPLTTASYLLNGHHQHAVMAPSPAQIHLAAVQVAAKNWGNNLLASHAPSPSSSKVVSPLRTPPHASAPTVQLEPKPEETSRRKNESLERAEAIRKEKVAEALRSKPQRGRKRDELNDDERLELTRTRNREHAKSTRIRKKARYQELLDREELYLDMHEEELRQAQRKQCLQHFFSVRQAMLIEKAKCQPKDQQSGEATSSSGRSSEPSGESKDDISSQLSNVIDATLPFNFDSLLPGGAEAADGEDAVSKMNEWDAALLDRIGGAVKSLNPETLASVEYEIESGLEGIALNNRGEAFCRVELSLAVPKSEGENKTIRKQVISGICSAQFSSQSNRLVSLKWTTMEDRCSGSPKRSVPGEPDSAGSHSSRETLASQLVHPSMVSLDIVRNVEPDENLHEPGMNI